MNEPNATLKPSSAGSFRAIDGFRGLAALGVLLFHYSCDILPTVTPHPLRAMFANGVYGVEVFFVLSGFVIPYSMVRAGYGRHALGPFMLKRYLRIAPLAYFSALLMILYHAVAVLVLGREISANDWPGVNWRSILGNLLFHPQPFGTEWFNFVHWTLAVEFQFYFAIALLLPLLLASGKPLRNALLVLGALALSFFAESYFFRDCGYFFLGVAVFLHRNGNISTRTFVLLVVASAVAAVHKLEPVVIDGETVITHVYEWVPLGLALATTAMLVWRPGMGNRFTDWLGDISYCLYLLHMPVGYFCDSLAKRVTGIHEHAWGRLVLFVVFCAVALASSHVLHVIAERPLLRKLKRIRFRRAEAPPTTA